MAVSSNEEDAKLGQKGSCDGHVRQFRNFGNPLISHERLKLETSNLARRRMAVNEEDAKLQKTHIQYCLWTVLVISTTRRCWQNRRV